MLWHENTQFRAVIVRADDPRIEHQRLPARDHIDEVRLDIRCFFHQCRCHKKPRETGCLRYTMVEPKQVPVLAYVDNDRGFRSWIGSTTTDPLLTPEEKE